MSGFENWKTPYKVKRENLVSLPLTGAACETVDGGRDSWPVRDWRARLDSLIKTRTRRAWKGFWLVCFSRFQELFLLELISCWVEIPKGWTNVVYFSVKICGKLRTTKILKKHGHLVHKCLRLLNALDWSNHKFAEPIINVIKICSIGI